LHRLAQPHVVGQHRAEARVAHEGQPVHTVSLVAAKLRRQILGQWTVRDSFEAGGEFLQTAEIGRDRLVQLLAQSGQLRQAATRERSVLAPCGEQVGDAGTVAIEPVLRQGGPAAPHQRHQRLASAPGVDDGPRVRAPHGRLLRAGGDELGMEGDLEGPGARSQLRLERPGKPEVLASGPADLAAPRREARGKRHGLEALVSLPHARHEPQARKSANLVALGLLVAQRQGAAEVHDSPAVDAGRRRGSVNQRRQHGQRVALPLDVDHGAGRFADGPRESIRLDPNDDASLQGRQHIGQEFRDRIRREVLAVFEVAPLPRRQLRVPHHAQRLSAQQGAVGEALGHAHLRLDDDLEPLAAIANDRHRKHGSVRHAHRPAVERHVRALRKPGKDARDDPRREHSVAVRGT